MAVVEKVAAADCFPLPRMRFGVEVSALSAVRDRIANPHRPVPSFKKLNRCRRNRVRKVAAKIFRQAKNQGMSQRSAEGYARSQVESEFFSWQSVLIKIAVALAIELIRHWWNQDASPDPMGNFADDEPGADL